VATVHDVVKETIRAHFTLVHIIHTYASADTPWVAQGLSRSTPIRYGLTKWFSKDVLSATRVSLNSYTLVHNHDIK
jgi:hypothetical protein